MWSIVVLGILLFATSVAPSSASAGSDAAPKGVTKRHAKDPNAVLLPAIAVSQRGKPARTRVGKSKTGIAYQVAGGRLLVTINGKQQWLREGRLLTADGFIIEARGGRLIEIDLAPPAQPTPTAPPAPPPAR